jgi:hypothetical protein
MNSVLGVLDLERESKAAMKEDEAAIIEAKGGTFHAGTVVESIEERDDGKEVVSTGGGKVVARAAVVAEMVCGHTLGLKIDRKELGWALLLWSEQLDSGEIATQDLSKLICDILANSQN